MHYKQLMMSVDFTPETLSRLPSAGASLRLVRIVTVLLPVIALLMLLSACTPESLPANIPRPLQGFGSLVCRLIRLFPDTGQRCTALIRLTDISQC